jgi:hypothetical protein
MDETGIERILRAIRTPVGGAPGGVGRRMLRGVDLGRSSARSKGRGEPAAGERRARTCVKDAAWISEAEARRLRKAIRTSFCNSPHQANAPMALGGWAAKKVRRKVDPHLGLSRPCSCSVTILASNVAG